MVGLKLTCCLRDMGHCPHHKTFLRAFLAAYSTSIHNKVEANEMPLDLRRRKLSSEYCLKVSSNVYNPVHSCIFSSQFTKFFDKYPNHIRPLGFRVFGDLSDIGFTQKNNPVTSVSSTPPWHLVTPTVDLSLSTLSKSVTLPEIYHSKFLEICDGLQDYYHIYIVFIVSCN